MSRRARALCAALVLAGLPRPSRAEPGLTAAAFLQRTVGARSAGMGSAFAAVPGSMDSLQYNPAGLATLHKGSLSSTYINGFGGTDLGSVAYGHPFRWGTLAAGALYYNAGAIDLNLSDGTRGRVTAEEDMAWTLSYAATPIPRLDVGATYRFLRMELAETARATSSQGDFGAIWRTPLGGLSLGAAYQYLGPDIRFEDAGDPPPKTFRYGASYRFPALDPSRVDPSVDLQAFDMTLAADMVQTLHEKASPRAGAEFGLQPALMTRAALRFGWVFGRDAESFSFGVGLRQGRFSLDYAFGGTRALGNLQQVTLGFSF